MGVVVGVDLLAGVEPADVEGRPGCATGADWACGGAAPGERGEGRADRRPRITVAAEDPGGPGVVLCGVSQVGLQRGAAGGAERGCGGRADHPDLPSRHALVGTIPSGILARGADLGRQPVGRGGGQGAPDDDAGGIAVEQRLQPVAAPGGLSDLNEPDGAPAHSCQITFSPVSYQASRWGA